MATKPILSVVRVLHVTPTEADFEASHFNVEWYRKRYDEAKRREDFRLYVQHHNTRAGHYLKSGGGNDTSDMQQAQIFGWSRKAKENLARYKAPYHEIIPVKLEAAV